MEDPIMPSCTFSLTIACLLLAPFALAAATPSGGALNGQKPRVIVSSDIGGDDNDDFQSMVHYLVYADIFDTEGLVSSPPSGGRAHHIHEVIDAYEADYSKLKTWASYPPPTALRNVVKQGAISAQGGSTPTTTISDGAQLIVDRAKANDSRPLNVLVWGSITDVAQAVHKDPSIKRKLRVYSIGSWNTGKDREARDYLYDNHANGSSDPLWWIENDTTFRGMYACAGSSGTYGNTSWPQNHVKNHGALGSLFMNKKPDIKMGDTPSVLYLMAGDPNDPSREHWGGSFALRSGVSATFWDDRTESTYECGGRNGAKTVHRWRSNFMDDWEQRMDRAKDAKSGGDTTPPATPTGLTANAVD
jgi:hypothetical protein